MNPVLNLVKTRETWRRATSALVLALLASGQLQAQTDSTGHPAQLRDLNAVRQQGCEGPPAQLAPLRENAALSAAAARLSGGDRLEEALKASGYRAVSGAQIVLRGAANATQVTRSSLGRSCSVLMPPNLTEAGFHQQAGQLWIVVAAPFMPPDTAQADEVQSRLLALVNEARAKPRRCGSESFAAARPVHFSAKLQTAAAVHATDMARHNYFDHVGRDGRHVEDRASSSGYRWRRIGENIAAGHTQADAAMQDWLASPGHCANVMSPDYTEMGSAFAVNNSSSAGIYWVQVFGTAR